MVLGFLLRLEWEKAGRKGKPEHAHPGVRRIAVQPGRLSPWCGDVPVVLESLGRML